MAKLEQTLPTPRILLALKNQSWTVSGAISELVDNSFGKGRGDARMVRITWNKATRTLDVLDTGRGMDSVTRLFQLGNTVGRSVGDIGQYGSGGTMAILWLAQKVSVWTLRDGKVAYGAVDWDAAVKSDEFPVIDADWYRATVSNTPSALLNYRSGTLIRLVFPPKRHVNESNVRRDLSRTYGPALRHGKRIVWETIGRYGASDEVELGDAIVRLPQPKHLAVHFDIDGEILGAVGRAAILPDLSISESSIAICFGPRAVRFTRDCYRAPDTDESFDGIGVIGYIDLDEGWQPYLTTTKTGIDDDRVWDALMAELFHQLRPLLDKVQKQREHMLLEDIGLELERIFNKNLSAVVDGGLTEDPDGEEVQGRMRSGKEKSDKPTRPASPDKAPGALKLEIVQVSDGEIDGLMCRVDVQGESELGCFVNGDHEWVRRAITARPQNRHALYQMIVREVADQIAGQRPDLLAKMFPKRVLDSIDAIEPRLRSGFIARLLTDRVVMAA